MLDVVRSSSAGAGGAKPLTDRRRLVWPIRIAVLLLIAGSAAGIRLVLSPAPRTAYVPRNVALRRASLYFYPANVRAGQARACVFFLGNDIGFWAPHQELAADLASQGYGVIGFDVKPLLERLPSATSASAITLRDSMFSNALGWRIRAACAELHLSGKPVILAGHSLGAEIAVWSAGHVVIPDLAGVLAISPGARGHLRVTWRDITDSGEPTEPGSFSVAGEVGKLVPSVRVVIVRGDHDPFRYADSGIVAAGGRRARLEIVPLAGHSLKRVILARYIVRSAADWIVSARQ